MKTRIQKIIAQAGIASRRTAEKMILEGRVSINGMRIVAMGTMADPEQDDIRVDGRLISVETNKIYLILNKPRGYVTTLDDPQNRPIVTDLLSEVHERIFPVGRLDYDSEGLLLLTNDGAFAQRLQHPRYQIMRTYRIKVEGHLSNREIRALSEGVPLDDGLFKPFEVTLEKKSVKTCWVVLTLAEGRNRVIRRAFAALNHPVVRL
ncbi:MAG: rRNA pseudouridine synthase, partial [Syntrophales bacterium]|nr:rRNA pseudouridine synthase [Syntrophales bacterium]